MKKWITAATASLLLLTSCAPSGGTVNDHAAIPKRLLSFPVAQYDYVAYVNERLMAFTQPSGGQLNVSSVAFCPYTF